ncbi:MAG TPA: carboxypeptidase regulatory-like domain-containing protein [Candidatus Sulfotelmatobacter sp.]
MLNLNFSNLHAQRNSSQGWFLLALLLVTTALMFSTPASAQSTVGTGSIVGTVTDPSGAVVNGAAVTITNVATSQVVSVSSNASGAFNSGALTPGNYKVQVTAKSFSGASEVVTVQVGNTSTFNPKLQLGQESQIIEVQASDVQVNTEQASVQGVLTAGQIDNLPVNGRNFLDLAQLEPGVQIQDGTNFDPTKVGYSSISFGGRFGRSARIQVDGVDVSDETVGTTTQDIPASAIGEFQLTQSKMDLSNDLTSSGAVNVTTKSGTNNYHGDAFGYFRDHTAIAAALPTPPGLSAPGFQRNQFGGDLGGPVIKDKLFFFADGERTLNNLQAPVSLPDPFTPDSGFFNAPFRETELLGKVDYTLSSNAKLFYRFNYFANLTDATFFSGSFMVYANKDDSRSHVLGLDFTKGSFSHSIRFEYLKFQNQIRNGDAGQPFSQSGLTLFNGPFSGGPNYLAPQSTPQSDHEYKYDGSKIVRTHIVRFGATFNHIQGGGFASFFSVAPVVTSAPNLLDPSCVAVSPSCPAGPDGTTASNFLNYDVQSITIGNGIGYSTTQAAFGFPAGGLGPDNRIAFYIGDSWKIKHNLNIEAGLRYVRDTGRNDADLPGIPALNGLVSSFQNLGARIRQPNLNFAPQLGLAWDPSGNGKTVIRAGAGLYYENTIWNNVLFDRPTREATGAFLQTTGACAGVGAAGPPIAIPGGSIPVPNGVCGNNGAPITIGAAAANIIALEHTYQSDYPFTPTLQNGGYIPSLLSQGLGIGTNAAPATFAPNFQTPRSLQMNVGFQREIKRGMVLSVDYLRNVETHSLLGVDLNHTGDTRYFNKNGALAAISATNHAFGCGFGTDSGSIDCAIGAGATMASYAANGLDTTAELGAYVPANPSLTSCPMVGCAFPGLNSTVSNLNFLLPIGRSVYNALDFKLVQNVNNPFKGVRNANFQFAYSLSRFVNPGGANPVGQPANYQQGSDQDFVIGAADNANPLRYMGPSTLDRTHQISFGGNFGLPWNFQTGLIAHFYSPLSTPLVVPNSGLGDGEIFRTDFTGDGTTQDFIPGTKNGAFMRDVSVSGLTNVINNYNHTVAGQPTPAGQVLISNGLFTAQELANAGGVAPTLPQPVTGTVGLAWLKDVDLSLSWKYRIAEKVTIQPGIGFFNVFNFANFDLPPNVLSPYLTGQQGNIGGTNYAQTQNVRVGAGTGVYGLGSPRVAEFNLKITF